MAGTSVGTLQEMCRFQVYKLLGRENLAKVSALIAISRANIFFTLMAEITALHFPLN